MKTMRSLFVGLLTLSLAVGALAAIEEPMTEMHVLAIKMQSTNWENGIEIPQFNPEYYGSCVLDSVLVEMCADVEGMARFESFDSSATTVTMNLQANVTLFLAYNGANLPIISALPLAATLDTVTAYDGELDYDGTSGRTYDDLQGSDCKDVTYKAQGWLDYFTGVGSIYFPVTALGSSFGTGGGNLVTQFQTEANANVTVTYYYSCSVATEDNSWSAIKELFR